ncbi:GNAT family N-acetyltransferase [Pseudohongiella spirulinae]|uniref:GNAT family N-acetyltransferase n=1 Tax=Pseudohongiella spirulinae TaxID=1249552 RepID=UPI000717910F|nr:GNAT family N-acetyltransferase [Pseudohongiella spirulinae]
MTAIPVNVRLGLSMAQINASDWNGLMIGGVPFLRHEFLAALEDSGSVSQQSGWQPAHLTVTQGERLIAAMPLYIKNNSYGEYVFDWSWADAYHRYGRHYYPKLLTAIPFTPSQSPRILLSEQTAMERIIPPMVNAIKDYLDEQGMSSWHMLFPEQPGLTDLLSLGLARRVGVQYHWLNHGYQSFDDFLATLSSRKRKNMKKERQSVVAQGVNFQHINAADATEKDWQTFYRFYQSTYEVRGQRGYLSKSFFEQIARTMPDNLFLIMARQHSDYVAGALFLKDTNTLYGRYWGCDQEFYNLHFETCYYQGIDYCIKHGLKKFDAGAQGEHKLRRGFEPLITQSFHWIADAGFRQAIMNFCQEEAAHIEQYKDHAEEYLPFKKSWHIDNKLAE